MTGNRILPAIPPEQSPSQSAFDRRVIPSGATESHWNAADGWTIRRIDWPVQTDPDAKPRGSILFMPGRGDIYEKYLETFGHFHDRGWNITSSDWRGQGGSGRYASSQYVGHIEDFALWIADLKLFYTRWKKEMPGPHVVIGHSMGGHLVARALIENAIDPDAAVLIAPMLGMAGLGLPLSISQLVARIIGNVRPGRPSCMESQRKARVTAGDTPDSAHA